MATTTGTITAGVTYAGSRKPPFAEQFAPETKLSGVRMAAMTYFEVADSTDASGNQTVYRLKSGGETMDLEKTLGDVAERRPRVEFRLVRELIAG